MGKAYLYLHCIKLTEAGKPAPNFFGYEIGDLYSFFMVFVVSAAVVSVVLFLLNRKLVKMMKARFKNFRLFCYKSPW